MRSSETSGRSDDPSVLRGKASIKAATLAGRTAVSGGNTNALQTAQPVGVTPRGHRLKRVAQFAASFILHILVMGVLAAVVLSLTIRDLGLVITAFALTIIFFFELVFRHNVRIGRIPEDRAQPLRIFMFPMVYLAAWGAAFPFLDAPGVDPSVRMSVVLTFVVLAFSAVIWSILVVRRMRRRQPVLAVRGPR